VEVRILFIGDIFGRPGLDVTSAYLAAFGEQYDFVIANGENATRGRGIVPGHFAELRAAGVDVVTLGNHSWDQQETLELVEETTRIVRPANYPPGTPGLGFTTLPARNGERATVAQVMGRVFLEPLDNPFSAIDAVIDAAPAGVPLIVDFHAEATSEKKVMGYHLQGRATAVLGTHTHVQTADEQVQGGTAYITDAGMTGVQDSSLGMAFSEVHYRFTRQLPRRYRPAEGPGTLCGVVITAQGARATSIERIRWTAEEP
jgi:metallophosphoesterase (TIGR00282 family)